MNGKDKKNQMMHLIRIHQKISQTNHKELKEFYVYSNQIEREKLKKLYKQKLVSQKIKNCKKINKLNLQEAI